MLASRSQRLGAALADTCIGMAVTLPVMMRMGLLQRLREGQPMSGGERVLFFIFGFAVFFVINGYFLARRGQTVGKMLVGTRIVSYAEGQLLPPGRLFGLRYLPIAVVAQIPYFGGLLWLMDVLLIFGPETRCGHDLIAGTKVVNVWGGPVSLDPMAMESSVKDDEQLALGVRRIGFQRRLGGIGRTVSMVTAWVSLVCFAFLATGLIVYVPREIGRNRRLVRSFASAATWIDDFAEIYGRLPNDDQYKAWATSQPRHFYGVQSIEIVSPSNSEFYQEVIDIFGRPTEPRAYALSIWTGEWNEYYASWADESTAESLPEDYVLYLLLFTFLVGGAIVSCKVARGPGRPRDAMMCQASSDSSLR